jgi:hypothetical protein
MELETLKKKEEEELEQLQKIKMEKASNLTNIQWGDVCFVIIMYI